MAKLDNHGGDRDPMKVNTVTISWIIEVQQKSET
jgi:hypothetical protein